MSGPSKSSVELRAPFQIIDIYEIDTRDHDAIDISCSEKSSVEFPG